MIIQNNHDSSVLITIISHPLSTMTDHHHPPCHGESPSAQDEAPRREAGRPLVGSDG